MYEVRLVAGVRVPPNDYETLQRHFADVIAKLVDQEEADPRLTAADLSVDLHEGRVELCISVTVTDVAEAMTVGKAAIRAAIHGAGGFTPGWDDARWTLEEDASSEQDLLGA